MKRAIKFRGKRCDDGEWVYGYYARLRNEFKEWHCIMIEEDASENYIKDCNGYNMLYTPVNHNTVGQFTGLYDKNGKEIYEGDIIQFTKGWKRKSKTDEWQEDNQIAEVIYFGAEFNIAQIASCSDVIKVLGNIYDNHNLLKGGEDD